tara:strand:- start:649 stop:846 length:198 start_codon:yes stop_codon:yes gene_type:complete
MSWLPQTYYDTIKRISQNIRGVEDKKVRARTEEGQYVGDDKSTPDIDEAYTTVEVKKTRDKPPKK